MVRWYVAHARGIQEFNVVRRTDSALDDPLQHNDVIHAAAFVDVMRNMVELQDYQLIMSTHKLDEGEFISRKFDAAGLPCTVVELVGASKEGVLVSAPRYNAAAHILLA